MKNNEKNFNFCSNIRNGHQKIPTKFMFTALSDSCLAGMGSLAKNGGK